MDPINVSKGISISFDNAKEAQDFLDHLIKKEDDRQQKFDRKKMSMIREQVDEFSEFVATCCVHSINKMQGLGLKLRVKSIEKSWDNFLNFKFTYKGEDDSIIKDMKDLQSKYFETLTNAYNKIHKFSKRYYMLRFWEDEEWIDITDRGIADDHDDDDEDDDDDDAQ